MRAGGGEACSACTQGMAVHWKKAHAEMLLHDPSLELMRCCSVLVRQERARVRAGPRQQSVVLPKPQARRSAAGAHLDVSIDVDHFLDAIHDRLIGNGAHNCRHCNVAGAGCRNARSETGLQWQVR